MEPMNVCAVIAFVRFVEVIHNGESFWLSFVYTLVFLAAASFFVVGGPGGSADGDSAKTVKPGGALDTQEEEAALTEQERRVTDWKRHHDFRKTHPKAVYHHRVPATEYIQKRMAIPAAVAGELGQITDFVMRDFIKDW
jgi:hypothetical protein